MWVIYKNDNGYWVRKCKNTMLRAVIARIFKKAPIASDVTGEIVSDENEDILTLVKNMIKHKREVINY